MTDEEMKALIDRLISTKPMTDKSTKEERNPHEMSSRELMEHVYAESTDEFVRELEGLVKEGYSLKDSILMLVPARVIWITARLAAIEHFIEKTYLERE